MGFEEDFTILELRRHLADAMAEIDRLKAGKFTAEEIHGICHNLHGTVDAEGFAEGCVAEQIKLYGKAPDRYKLALIRQRLWSAEQAWHDLKQMTKEYPASYWSTEYRKLANYIHIKGRDLFPVEQCAKESAEDKPKKCSWGHESKVVGCVSCVIVFDYDSRSKF